MEAGIVHGRRVRGDLVLDVDVVVCGAGAGGAMAARELARAGARVVVLEEGPDLLPEACSEREDEMLPELFQDLGGRRTADLGVLVLGGRGLGGSTLHNTNLCRRAPPAILDEWRAEHGLSALDATTMETLYAEVEHDLGVVQIADAQVAGANDVMRRGRTALGWRGGRLSHNRDERCNGCGFCELGCAYDAKRGARSVLLPAAVAHGARIYSDTRVDRVVHADGVVRAVRATFLGDDRRPRGTLELRTRAVCLAGSAIGSAALALASDLPDPYERAGRGLRIHPGIPVAGFFDERIESWRGIPQSEDCTEWLDFAPGSQRRVWLVPSFAHPAATATLTPGFGPALLARMHRFPHVAVVAALVHDLTEGRVRLAGARTRIDYAPDAADREQLALGARAAARVLLAAGAREVFVPAAPAITATTEHDLEAIVADRFRPCDAKLTSVHPMGTLAMGSDPRRSVVGPDGMHHHVRGVFVTDGSLFPTSLGGPPQITIYALAMRVARRAAEWLGRPQDFSRSSASAT